MQEMCRRYRLNPWVRTIPWRGKWQPTLIFLPGKSHEQRTLEGYSPWGGKRVRHDMAHQHNVILTETLLRAQQKYMEAFLSKKEHVVTLLRERFLTG